MTRRTCGTIIRAIALMTATLSSAAVFAMQASSTQPSTQPARSGEWFAAAAATTTKPGIETDAQIFARLYPELAKADPAIRAATPRVLFDALGSKGKPPLKIPRMVNANSPFTEASDRAYKASKPLDPWLLVADERKTRIMAVQARQLDASVFLDIEQLPLDTRHSSAAEVERSVQIIAKTVGWVRAQDPNLRLFFYAGFPAGDNYLGPSRARGAATKPVGDAHGWFKASAARFETEREALRAASAKLTTLASLFDGTCPSLYIYQYEELMETTTAIPGFVRETVNESRRYGKPVYPFVWYELVGTNIPVPLPQWTTLMREVMTHADGAILWAIEHPWNNRFALRVRIAKLLAESKGVMTDAEIYEIVKADYPGDPELQVLRGDVPATQPR